MRPKYVKRYLLCPSSKCNPVSATVLHILLTLKEIWVKAISPLFKASAFAIITEISSTDKKCKKHEKKVLTCFGELD